jgi:transcriptional regulator with GAF, ATPase, and Fis domain
MSEELINMFTEMVETLVPCADLKEMLTRAVKATNQFFGAERGGIFLFGQIGATKSPVLMGSCNLSDADVSAETFKSNLALVFKTFRENRPQIVRSGIKAAIPYPLKAVMCVPFVDENQVKGVLYHDNSYIEDCFDHFDDSQLLRIAGSFTRYIGRIRRFSRQMEGKVITLPPLRERNEDVPFLARHFLSLYAAKHNQLVSGLSQEDETLLLAYHWPGNVRELKNVMERAVLLSTKDRLEISLPVKRSLSSDDCFSDLKFREVRA